jgi:beta-galactosidase
LNATSLSGALACLLLLSEGAWRLHAEPAQGMNEIDPGGWQFYRGTPAGLVEEQESGGELSIRKTDRGAADHVWWRQRHEADEGGVFRLSFEARGTGEEDHSIYGGVDFLGPDGKVAGFQEIRKVCYVNPKFPKATLPDVPEWKTFEGDFVVPRGAAFYSVRLALGASAPAEAGFRNVVVTKAAVPLNEALERLPEEIPIQAIPQGPVRAAGVTLTPNHKLEGAERVQSQTRERICLNGLWAIQPARKGEPPKADDWAFMKVPNAFLPGEPYLAYGREKTSWKALDLYSKAEALWFVRDVEIPASAPGSKVFLDVESFRGFALAAYWNGKRIGTLTSQRGGRFDLSEAARKGGKGQLALYALAIPPEAKYAYLMEAGRMTRQYDGSRFARERNRSLYDRGISNVDLQFEPASPIFSPPRVVPSTRNQSLEISWDAGAADADGLTFALTVKDRDGKAVLEQDKLAAGKRPGGWTLEVPWKNPRLWTPDDPYLHTLALRAVDAGGKIVDETLPISFGFREVWVEGKNLMMNGRPLHLRPKLAFTSFLDGPALRRHFSVLKDMGFNCVIRPRSGETDQLEIYEQQSLADLYGAADELGLFVIPYTPYLLISRGQFGTDGVEEADLDEMMQYLRRTQTGPLFNHPSVIAYSGFGGGYSEGINYINPRPDTWGVSPLGQPGVLEKVLSSEENRQKALENIGRSKDFIERFKALDPTRPFLSHIDGGEADGWGIFDYFNWTPVQEWEEWPLAWARNGVMPIGSTEHGLPYPGSFVNHGIPDGDNEPWVTEYSAMVLGPHAYENEPSDYLQFISSTFNKTTGVFPGKTGAHHTYAKAAAKKNWTNVQSVWASNNKAIYRAWRTYGIPMGIEPFGRLDNLIEDDLLKKDVGKIVAKPGQELRTTGAKLDRYIYFSYWPDEAMPSRPSSPSGRKPEGLTPLGETLHEVNSPLLVYLGGPAARVTAKDHVFAAGEKISKQIVAVWDGFSKRTLELAWKASLGANTVAEGRETVTLEPGDITFLPVEFAAPAVTERSEGAIELTVTDAQSREALPGDRFALQIYPALSLPPRVQKARIVLFDPAGGSEAALARLGIKPDVIRSLSEWKGGDLLVVARGALPEFGRQSLDGVPASVPVLVLEQEAGALENAGFRAYPMRTRRVFPMREDHPVLRGIGAPDLSDWRVEPALLPAGVEPLRGGYNYHTGYYGTVASVTIEVPTAGNFTPLLQNGFDLRETPLLEATLQGRQWVFCQLSVVDVLPELPSAGDPVGARLLVNLLDDLLRETSRASSPFVVLGSREDADLARELGAAVQNPSAPAQLMGAKTAWIGKGAMDPLALKTWVAQGGTAVVLPQAQEFYSAAVPSVTATPGQASLFPLPEGAVFEGLSAADFHYRQSLPQLVFNGKSNAVELPHGKGKWILLGFDPKAIDLAGSPWLRLTYRHQCRVLAQVLTNLGVALDGPGKAMQERLRRQPWNMDLAASAQARIEETKEAESGKWTAPDFDDSQWEPFNVASQGTAMGNACVRIRFKAPADAPPGDLVASLGTIDDYDETWLNGVKIGSVNPGNSRPEQAWKTQRVYEIPPGLLKPGGENVLAIRLWNRNAAKGASAILRGPLALKPASAGITPYAGTYKHSDDPYLQYHW